MNSDAIEKVIGILWSLALSISFLTFSSYSSTFFLSVLISSLRAFKKIFDQIDSNELAVSGN